MPEEAHIDSRGEEGFALLGVMLMMLILSIFGLVSLNLAVQEIQEVRESSDYIAARYVAEAGIDAILGQFQKPMNTEFGSTFLKRYEGEDGPSFTGDGHSQFSGTLASPDFLLDAARLADDRLLNDGDAGWFRTLSPLGKVDTLRIYKPQRPGLLCTVDIIGSVRGIKRGVSAQLAAIHVPAIKVGGLVMGGDDGESHLPLLLHWGTVKLGGDLFISDIRDVPTKTPLAPVTVQRYAEMSVTEDRWLEILVGGEIKGPYAQSGLPFNVHPRQASAPHFYDGRWQYEEIKMHAKQYGTYYRVGSDGLLYRDGRVGPEEGILPSEAFESKEVGDDRGLVFIDSLDGTAPHDGNMPTIEVDLDYAQGLFVVNGHVKLKAGTRGRPISVLTPPTDTSSTYASRVRLTLPNVHLNGPLKVAGNLSYEGTPHLYGAVLVGRSLRKLANDLMEVWYNFEFGQGYFRGLPVVHVVPGTWQERY